MQASLTRGRTNTMASPDSHVSKKRRLSEEADKKPPLRTNVSLVLGVSSKDDRQTPLLLQTISAHPSVVSAATGKGLLIGDRKDTFFACTGVLVEFMSKTFERDQDPCVLSEFMYAATQLLVWGKYLTKEWEIGLAWGEARRICDIVQGGAEDVLRQTLASLDPQVWKPYIELGTEILKVAPTTPTRISVGEFEQEMARASSNTVICRTNRPLKKHGVEPRIFIPNLHVFQVAPKTHVKFAHIYNVMKINSPDTEFDPTAFLGRCAGPGFSTGLLCYAKALYADSQGDNTQPWKKIMEAIRNRAVMETLSTARKKPFVEAREIMYTFDEAELRAISEKENGSSRASSRAASPP